MIVRFLFAFFIVISFLFVYNLKFNNRDWDANIEFMQNSNQSQVEIVTSANDNTYDINKNYLDKKFEGHYINRALSNSKIIRWNPETFPLKVYIQKDTKLPDYYYLSVKKAFGVWQSISGDFITFKYINDKENANIRCIFSYNLNDGKSDTYAALATTTPIITDNILKYININILPYDYKTKKDVDETILYRVLLHEIGHALGIWGHSINHSDIMYPSIDGNREISPNDINTLKLIYSIVPDITNKEFSKDVKEKFLTADDIFGNSHARYKMEIESIKDDINNSGYFTGNKTTYLGYLYYKTKQYNKARDILENVIKNNQNDYNAYDTLEKVYKHQKDFQALENLYTQAEKLFPNNPPIKKY